MPPIKRSVDDQLQSANDDLLRIIELATSDDWLRVLYKTDPRDSAGKVIKQARKLLAEIADIARG